ncbi:Mrf1 protein [Starmerella bacillaris]|uniref:Peptide chain release factor 1, mitochondrial n=1 Tax=Starmerella bacillaris TaxID=1247836 RepID=A0AAV5RP03_STABA|nr:Mrf1 protein [Starmerella bacillaris]
MFRNYALTKAMTSKLSSLESEYKTISNEFNDNYSIDLEKKLARIRPIITKYNEYKNTETEISELKSLTLDPELGNEAKKELSDSSENLKKLEQEIKYLLIPKSENYESSCMIEIRPGIGGSEAQLFASDLLKMYQNFCSNKKWAHETLVSSYNTTGGLIEANILIKEPSSFGYFQHEAGVHRVQRIPATEVKGRVHTSTAAVVVLPEISEEEFTIDMRELRFDVMRASGSGGQHVNTTESAVRVVHLPTNTIVTCQDERSQHQNKARALKVLQTRLAERDRLEKQLKTQQARTSQVNTTDRSDRIRTYNYPQNRITDHRSNVSLHHLSEVMEGGLKLSEIIESVDSALKNAYQG